MSSTVQAILLGTAQDAGVPQAGCYCPNCQRARQDPAHRHLVVSLGLVDHAAQKSWIIDATPDFKEQLHLLHQFAPDCPLAGILLTHIHIGHYTGLIHLGPEAMNTRSLVVFVSEKVNQFLRENQPWSFLIERNHIQPNPFLPNESLALSNALAVQPISVPHRDELSDTMAFTISGPQRRLFYCPDIDSWDDWAVNLPQFMAGMDIALLDAPFFSAAELRHRDITKVRHPLVTDTISRLRGTPCEVHLIHLNHTNPLLANGTEYDQVLDQGFYVGRLGKYWDL